MQNTVASATEHSLSWLGDLPELDPMVGYYEGERTRLTDSLEGIEKDITRMRSRLSAMRDEEVGLRSRQRELLSDVAAGNLEARPEVEASTQALGSLKGEISASLERLDDLQTLRDDISERELPETKRSLAQLRESYIRELTGNLVPGLMAEVQEKLIRLTALRALSGRERPSAVFHEPVPPKMWRSTLEIPQVHSLVAELREFVGGLK